MDKLNMQTKDLANDKFEKFKELFPNAITETIDEYGNVIRAIDKDILAQEISTKVVEGREERYQFTWPDKRKAILAANSPISKTLRPCREESVNFDETENLYIEGDNLEVLKLLQETYLGKIKMIYIDPPYNTGNDFIYKDNFSQNKEEYLHSSGQRDEDNNILERNIESNGRFHTNWLNMMYPRLKLARNLLSEDGLIFISIDDHEVENLKKLCNEIFGEDNFIEEYIWESNFRPDNSSSLIRKNSEYILLFSKEKRYIERLVGTVTQSTGLPSLTKNSMKTSTLKFNKDYVKTFLKDGKYKKGEKKGGYVLENDIEVKNGKFLDDIFLTGKMIWGQEYLEKQFLDGTEIIIKSDGFVPYSKKKETTSAPNKIIPKHIVKDVLKGRSEVSNLFDGLPIFDYPKPISLIMYFLTIINDKDALVLDFFSGSASTANAVMEMNLKDNGNRRFILVQIPEKVKNDSIAYKNGYLNICEVGKERIRRGILRIKEKLSVDSNYRSKYLGFRVLKTDSSNMKNVYYSPGETEQHLLDFLSDNIKEDRTPEDLLFQVMLDLGISLSSSIQKVKIDNKNVYVVADGFLIACFDQSLNDEIVKEIAKKEPYYAIFRDSAMATDSVATNFDQIFENISPKTIRKVL